RGCDQEQRYRERNSRDSLPRGAHTFRETLTQPGELATHRRRKPVTELVKESFRVVSFGEKRLRVDTEQFGPLFVGETCRTEVDGVAGGRAPERGVDRRCLAGDALHDPLEHA